MSKLINVCHAYLFFSIKFAGGTSDLMYKICKAQENSYVSPAICTTDHKIDMELVQKLSKTKFHIFKSWLNKQGFSIIPSFYHKMDKVIQNYDIVHMHVYRTFQNVILYWLCRKHNIHYIIDAHGAMPYFTRKNILKKWFDKLIGHKMLKHASALIAETQVGVQEYLDILPSLNQDKITVISPPFDTEEFHSIPERGHFRKRFGIPDDTKVIVFIGRIHYIKGNDFLIKAFARYQQNNLNSYLVIIGSDDGHLEDCKKLAASLATNILFPGFLSGNEKLSALVDADLVAQMSRLEQGAWAPFEAILCRTPIVVTENTGAGEDVQKIDAGYTAPFGEIDQLAKTFEYIFNHYDEAKAKAIKAKNYIETHMSMNARSHEYADLYQKCINKR